MTRRPTDCVSAWGWNRGQQNGMDKLCKKTIDRKGAFRHHALTHALDNANRYATRSKSESKMWREPLGSKMRRIPPHFASSHNELFMVLFQQAEHLYGTLLTSSKTTNHSE